MFGAHVGLDLYAAAAALFAADAETAHPIIDGWMQAMREAGRSAATRNRRMSMLASLVRYARREGVSRLDLDLQRDIIEPVRNMAGPGPEAMAAMFDAAANGVAPVRDVALLHALFSVGLRVSEAISLDLHHLGASSDGPVIRPRRKGREQRPETPIAGEALAAVEALIEERRAAGAAGSDALFVSVRRGDRLSRQSVAVIVRRLCAGYTSPHRLRHEGATQLAHGGASVQQVAAWLAHSGTNLAQRYFDGKSRAARDAVVKLSKKRD